jgi:hypothetical protein
VAQRGERNQKAGRYGVALRDYLWCLDHGAEADSDFVPYRDSHLLDSLSRLLEKYEPTREALVARRRALEERLMKGEAQPNDGALYVGLNRILDDEKRSTQVYLSVQQDWARLDAELNELWPAVFSVLYAERRYDEMVAQSYQTNRQLESMKKVIEQREQLKMPLGERKNRYLTFAAMQYEALLATKKTTLATDMGEALLELDSTGATFAMLISHAIRADALGEARMRYEQAKRRLPLPEQPVVHEAAKPLNE